MMRSWSAQSCSSAGRADDAPRMNVLITGASRGLGFEHVRQALGAGEHVVACCRSPGRAGELTALLDRHGDLLRIESLDVSDGGSLDGLAERISGVPIDRLINNAGVYGGSWGTGTDRQSLKAMDYELWREMLDVNVIGPFRTTARLMPNLRLAERPLVVMMSSELGSIAGNNVGQAHAYRSSKAALNMLTRGLAIELKAEGIAVVSLAPGWTKTEMGGPAAQWEVGESVERQRSVLAGLHPDRSGVFIDLLGNVLPW
jgi:NAD(P)-dependent dehydrogenase (short-subunit alcohol dehydrogenase family)